MYVEVEGSSKPAEKLRAGPSSSPGFMDVWSRKLLALMWWTWRSYSDIHLSNLNKRDWHRLYTLVKKSKAYSPQCHWAAPPSSPLEKYTFLNANEPFHSNPDSFYHPKWRKKHLIGTDVSLNFHFGFTIYITLLLTCRSSSSLTRDQLLMKLWLSKARTGELSRTVSRRVRPEPTVDKEKPKRTEHKSKKHLI